MARENRLGGAGRPHHSAASRDEPDLLFLSKGKEQAIDPLNEEDFDTRVPNPRPKKPGS